MRCPICGRATIVIDKRDRTYGVRRRRECISCEARFTTVESPVTVVNRRAAALYARGTMELAGHAPEQER